MLQEFRKNKSANLNQKIKTHKLIIIYIIVQKYVVFNFVLLLCILLFYSFNK